MTDLTNRLLVAAFLSAYAAAGVAMIVLQAIS